MVLPSRRYVDFSGRSQWLFVLFQWLVFLPLGLLFAAAGDDIGKLANTPSRCRRPSAQRPMLGD